MSEPTFKPRIPKPPPVRLNAPRFNNDPVLTQCLAGTHRMLAGHTGTAVKLVQQALIDLGHDLGNRADDGVFGDLTGKAVTGFKTGRGIFPNDPVVGAKTMAALDAEMLDKPPAPLSDRDEWLSWARRAKLPRVGPYNFTRYDEYARRQAGKPFRLDQISSWMPPAFADVFLDHLSALLDPFGSPQGRGTPPATWGLSPADLFHCHVGLPVPQGSAPADLLFQEGGLAGNLLKLQALANEAPLARQYNDAWSAAHAALLLTEGVSTVFPMAAKLINDLSAAATPAEPAVLLWHTFERQGWRPHVSPGVEMPVTDPRRHWISTFAPGAQRPARTGIMLPKQLTDSFHLFFSIHFVVRKDAVVTALPGYFAEVASVTGITNDFAP